MKKLILLVLAMTGVGVYATGSDNGSEGFCKAFAFRVVNQNKLENFTYVPERAEYVWEDCHHQHWRLMPYDCDVKSRCKRMWDAERGCYVVPLALRSTIINGRFVPVLKCFDTKDNLQNDVCGTTVLEDGDGSRPFYAWRKSGCFADC